MEIPTIRGGHFKERRPSRTNILPRPQMKFWKVVLLSVVAGGAWGALMLWMGLQDNNQGEYFDQATGDIQWAQCLLTVLWPCLLLGGPLILWHLVRFALEHSRKIGVGTRCPPEELWEQPKRDQKHRK
jgi:hypothetical protein